MEHKNILILGHKGLLGTAMMSQLQFGGWNAVGLDLPEFDILKDDLDSFLKQNKINILINCAAYTDVAKAEIDRVFAMNLNSSVLGDIGVACKRNSTNLIHFSTDFVFDGKSQHPYTETAQPCPINIYGVTKLLGEHTLQNIFWDKRHFTIFRLQWLFGHHPKTFFSRLWAATQKNGTAQIVAGEYGSPCSVNFVSAVVLSYIFGDFPFTGETYHLTHDNYCDRISCGEFFLKHRGFQGPVLPYIGTSDVPRPKFGVLNNTKLCSLLGRSLGTWESDVLQYIEELEELSCSVK